MKYGIHSLVFKQCLIILVGFTVVFGSLFISVKSLVGTRVSEMLVEHGMEISEKNVAHIDKIFAETEIMAENVLNVLGRERPTVAEFPDMLSNLLKLAHENIPQVVAIVLANEPTKNDEFMRLAYWDSDSIQILEGRNYTEKAWYRKVKSERRALWHEPFVGDFIQEPIAVYSVPYFIRSEDGSERFAGVICIDISLAFLQETVSSIEVDRGGYAFVLSADHMIVAHPREDWVYKESLGTLSRKNDNRLAGFGEKVQQNRRGVFFGESFGGGNICIYYTPMKIKDWTFGVVWPSDRFFEQQKNLARYLAIFSLCGYGFIFLIVLAVSFRVARPLNKMSRVARDLGKGNFDVKIPKIRGRDEVAQFSKAFETMRGSLNEYIRNLKDVTEKNMRMESELNVARNIQLGVLPRNEDEESMRDGRHELAAYLQPAREVGGDFYDFYPLDMDRIVFMIADVSGKGVPAALFMMSARTQLKALAMTGMPLNEVLNYANERLCHKNDGDMFVTVWMGILDLRTGHVDFCNAGHNPPAIRHADGTVNFISGRPGLVLAGMNGTKYKIQSIDLLPGETLLLYTDGVTEACDHAENFFGNDRLLNALKEGVCPNGNLCEFVKSRIDEFVGDAPQFDDITMLALKYIGVERKENAGMKKEITVDSKLENVQVLTEFVEKELAPFNPSTKAVMQLGVVVDELFSNVVRYSGAHSMTLSLEVDADMLCASMTFIDEGFEYDPLKKADPDVTLSADDREVGGLGIFLVKKTMDDIEYRRVGSQNILKVTKKIN